MKIKSRKFLFKPSRIVIIGSMNFYNKSTSSALGVDPRGIFAPLDIFEPDEELPLPFQTERVFQNEKHQFDIKIDRNIEKSKSRIGIETQRFDYSSKVWQIDLTDFMLPVYEWAEFSKALLGVLPRLEAGMQLFNPETAKATYSNDGDIVAFDDVRFYECAQFRFMGKIILVKLQPYIGIQALKFDDEAKRWKLTMRGIFLAAPKWKAFATALTTKLKALETEFAPLPPNSQSSSVRFDAAKLPTYSSNVNVRTSPHTVPIRIIETSPPIIIRPRQGMLGTPPRT